ncbi:hypothetical protein JAAARDRAFT_32718 [Jaapia argillacea MUCL 33604]|uniref:F-box domain-containing protein n=1 Tax=Jaapia argillacea MUCL 33604 TaxID=933084 RepID=A0A067Q9Z0_9AGAM|nr:hypothetical protein JAAARDRAFT_32718 [Jaapia argillacea MUCL 33604]
MAWSSLPPEIKLNVIDLLEVEQIKALASIDSETRSLCVPFVFKSVNVKSYEDLLNFLDEVPRDYYQCIRRLSLCTKSTKDNNAQGVFFTHATTDNPSPHPRTDALIALIAHCARLEELSLLLMGSLANTIIPYFEMLHNLRSLTIDNAGDEERTPISERLAVSIAASCPTLTHLSLSCISRSVIHASESLGVYPYIPLVSNDDDVPPHPRLGSALSLPSLLSIPTLKKLAIRDTHLGDPLWESVDPQCHLEVLDLGSSYHETDERNRTYIECILAKVYSTVDEFTLNTSITSIPPAMRLRRLRLTPLVPLSRFTQTLSSFSTSPVEKISIECHEEDLVDVCETLEEFLSTRVEMTELGFFKDLSDVSLTIKHEGDETWSSVGEGMSFKDGLLLDREERLQRLQEYCRDLNLTGLLADLGCEVVATSEGEKRVVVDRQL